MQQGYKRIFARIKGSHAVKKFPSLCFSKPFLILNRLRNNTSLKPKTVVGIRSGR
ncbi:hypothetical protein LEP1GSC050_3442 [Leptospira broomii serovar Hurstbridge str. 5399]|uniref:Uncharacterized protein n=1 Tax=Leptospira broomii serovar Hurstbridge str. 5399 TaxID=1049789 RepID=T0FE33_9LEPT|nr:hypothetical protein LEP1GSC050_3442 [Leptospira broomii serovar Hurstbridge str. 5399]